MPNFIVISDLDGTLTEVPSSWQFVLEDQNLWDLGKLNLELFLSKKINYDEFIKLDVELLKNLPTDSYLNSINKIKFRDDFKPVFEFFKMRGGKLILISSGLMDLAKVANEKFQFDNIFANELLKENGKLNGKYITNVGWNDKGKIMNEISTLNKNSPIITLGDSSGDLPLIKHSQLSFSCFSSNQELNKLATYEINNAEEIKSIISIVEKFLKEL